MKVNQKGFTPLLIILGVVLVLGISAGTFYFANHSSNPAKNIPSPSPAQVACTQDAKLCPDGSYVARIAPKCEFSPCPTPKESTNSAETANWKTYTNKNISFQYPSDWVVIFDSKVINQPNGFGLHVTAKNASEYQPDQLSLNTYNDRSNTTRGYVLSQDKKFIKTDQGDDYIQFIENGTSFYVGCAFYAKGQDTIKICNQILSTFKLIPYIKITRAQAIDCVTKEAAKLYPNTKFKVIVTSEDDNGYSTSVVEDTPQESLMGWFPVNGVTCETHFAKP